MPFFVADVAGVGMGAEPTAMRITRSRLELRGSATKPHPLLAFCVKISFLINDLRVIQTMGLIPFTRSKSSFHTVSNRVTTRRLHRTGGFFVASCRVISCD